MKLEVLKAYYSRAGFFIPPEWPQDIQSQYENSPWKPARRCPSRTSTWTPGWPKADKPATTRPWPCTNWSRRRCPICSRATRCSSKKKFEQQMQNGNTSITRASPRSPSTWRTWSARSTPPTATGPPTSSIASSGKTPATSIAAPSKTATISSNPSPPTKRPPGHRIPPGPSRSVRKGPGNRQGRSGPPGHVQG